MNKQYKEYFNNINPSDELKNKILNKTIYKKNYILKYVYATFSIFIICFLTTTIIYADDIYNYIIEYHEKENYIEIKPPINYKLNTKATLLNCYTVNDFENDLEIDLLESTMLDSTLKLDYKLYTTDNTLQRITLIKSINTKDYFDDLEFTEVETPILGKATPEGARDYLVPSRIHNGKFYALPQSPQIFKQLLMITGLERYYQIAKCFRDEDLRADRQPEFTQIDIEMSFVDLETLYGVIEGMFKKVWKDIKGLELATFPRLTWKECMERYGSDKPDIRYSMELINISSVFTNSSFEFLNGKIVKAIVAKNAASAFTRKDIDAYTELAKKYHAKGLLVTDWGDIGHLQYLPASYPGFSYTAIKSWSDGDESDIIEGVNLFIDDSLSKNEILSLLASIGKQLKDYECFTHFEIFSDSLGKPMYASINLKKQDYM